MLSREATPDGKVLVGTAKNQETDMLRRVAFSVCLLTISLYLFFPSSAHAYLDPGTGSYIFQLLLAGIVGFLFILKVYWKKIKAFFTSLVSREEEADTDEAENV